MTKRWLPLVLLSILCVLAGLTEPVRAQSGDVNQLYHEIDRLRQDLRDLQAYVFSSDQTGAAPEMAAGAAAEGQSAARLAADLEYRMGLVDEQFRMMTGQFEGARPSHAAARATHREVGRRHGFPSRRA